MARLTVLSHGMGQDSTTILEILINNPVLRELYAPEDLVVIFAETNDEHKETYDHLVQTVKRCQEHNIPFIHVHPDMGFHTGNWQGLREFYRATKTVGSKAFPKTCTDKLKLQPIYKCLEQYLGDVYGVATGRKKGFYEFTKYYGKIDVLIGIAKGEEKRIADPTKDPHKWKRENINIVYPLIDLGIDRAGCHDLLTFYRRPIPLPSNCVLCPFMSLQELLYLWRFLPEDYYDWVDIERIKIEDNLDKGDRNLGVWGKKLLPQMLKEAEAKFGHLTDEELLDYKNSHGHCVASKY